MPADATGDRPVQPRYGRIGTRQSAAQPPVVTAYAVDTGNARRTAMGSKTDKITGRIKGRWVRSQITTTSSARDSEIRRWGR
jgi:hypothetical protein